MLSVRSLSCEDGLSCGGRDTIDHSLSSLQLLKDMQKVRPFLWKHALPSLKSDIR